MKILVANDKGGVGKSTIAQYFIVRMQKKYKQISILEWDFQPKLHRFFGRAEVRTFGLQVPASSDEDAHTLLSHFDPIVNILKITRPCVIDFGAQGWHQFTYWAEMSALKDFVKSDMITIISPLTADIESLDGVAYVIQSAKDILPGANIVVPLVDKDGDVSSFRGIPEYENILKMNAQNEIFVRKVKKLPPNGYSILASRGIRMDEIETMSAVDAVSRVPLNPMAAGRAIQGVKEWLHHMDDEFSFILTN